jgi:hypothetical protein
VDYKRNRSRRRYRRISAATGRERRFTPRPITRKPLGHSLLVYRASYEIGGENYFAAMMAFAARRRTCEWEEKLAAAQPEISPETYLYARVLRDKGNYENQSEKQVGQNLRHRRQFGLQF